MELCEELQQALSECDRLRTENDYLKKIIQQQYHSASAIHHSAELSVVTNESSKYDKIKLFNSLFKGRTDVFAKRYELKNGKSGYSPACSNEWVPGVCRKPKIKCSECLVRALTPISDQGIYDHLSGKDVMGLYPLLKDDTCWFLAIDFDKGKWQEDVNVFTEICRTVNVPYSIERSRSGNGAHVWIFFREQIPAKIARKLGVFLLKEAGETRFEIALPSYDRMFPNQDSLPDKGFGNLIALPLQGQARMEDNSVFVDESFQPYPDQWLYLSTVLKLDRKGVERVIKELSNPEAEENNESPGPLESAQWKNGIYIKKSGLPSSLLAKIHDAASFHNPEFYRLQAKRYSTYGVPKRIDCADMTDNHLIVPRGCVNEVREIVDSYDVKFEISDQRNEGDQINVAFKGELRPQQQIAVDKMKEHEHGVVSATTGFGKTVTAAALIANRNTNTLIIVHRKQLMQQWVEQLSAFLSVRKDEIGQIGGGKRKQTGRIDVAMIQSLSRDGGVDPVVTQYGQVIVDECHHLSAVTFERVMKQIRAKYVYGLTATLTRKDGLHPIITMQCGPVIYKADAKEQAKIRPYNHRIIVRNTSFKTKSEKFQEICNELIDDSSRNERLFNDVLLELEAGRTPLILTERVQHIEELLKLFKGFVKNIVMLTGGMKKKEQDLALEKLDSISEKEELLVIATGKYIGEGFDYPRLDTLFLPMPISWKGVLQQYVGRLHRDYPDKSEVRVYDYVDKHVPVLMKMHEKRLAGFAAMGYVDGSKEKESSEQMQLF